MQEDSVSENYKNNTLLQDKLLWVAREYQKQGIARLRPCRSGYLQLCDADRTYPGHGAQPPSHHEERLSPRRMVYRRAQNVEPNGQRPECNCRIYRY